MGIFDNFNLMHGPRNLLKIEKKNIQTSLSTIVTSTVMHVVQSTHAHFYMFEL